MLQTNKTDYSWSGAEFNGIFQEFYPSGICGYEGFFRNGKPCGEHIGRHENGKLSIKQSYINGKRKGLKKEWYESGQICSIAHYLNGKLQGVRCDFHESGKLQSIEYFQNDLLHGYCSRWFENGVLMYRKKYVLGNLQGVVKYFYPNGNCMSSGNYIGGRLHGKFYYWSEAGKPELPTYYIRGVAVGEDVYKLINRGELKVAQIISIPNATIRRVCLEELGYSRFLSQLHHTVIDRDVENDLVRIDWHAQEKPLYLVKVRCPSTGAFYALRVPPTMKSVKEAVAWTFGLKPSEYKPEEEA